MLGLGDIRLVLNKIRGWVYQHTSACIASHPQIYENITISQNQILHRQGQLLIYPHLAC
jgi:hypothetical protein